MAKGAVGISKPELRLKTRDFALAVLKLVRELPKETAGRVVAHQLIRSSTSVGANYRSACRARSSAEFAAKLGVVLEEADESSYWIELAMLDGMVPKERAVSLIREADEICAITYSTIRSTRTKIEQGSSDPSEKPRTSKSSRAPR